MNAQWLSTKVALSLAATAVVAFHLAYEFEAAACLIVIYLACLFQLAWLRSARWAFYVGMAIGMAIAAVQLRFFFGIFGWAATGLWAIFGIWIALFLALSRTVVGRWPRLGALWVPPIWFALEYFRSELYYVRFAWLTPGFSLSHPHFVNFSAAGVYGFSFVVLSAIVVLRMIGKRAAFPSTACIIPILFAATCGATFDRGPLVVGIQLEAPSEDDVLGALGEALRDRPDLDIAVLSEYCFNGPVPPSVCGWCAQHKKYLIAGGKEILDAGGGYYNTAFVVSPAGDVVFHQAKAVPIQFFNDGLPAREQNVWESPWGKIGIAICYDLSYARVMDRLVGAGAQAFIIPTMDAEGWGERQHRLHSKIAPVRAREYSIPIFRLASSGISQFVGPDGKVIASTPFPGQGQRLSGRLVLGKPGSLPLDRYLALPVVAAVAGLLFYLAASEFHRRFRRA